MTDAAMWVDLFVWWLLGVAAHVRLLRSDWPTARGVRVPDYSMLNPACQIKTLHPCNTIVHSNVEVCGIFEHGRTQPPRPYVRPAPTTMPGAPERAAR